MIHGGEEYDEDEDYSTDYTDYNDSDEPLISDPWAPYDPTEEHAKNPIEPTKKHPPRRLRNRKKRKRRKNKRPRHKLRAHNKGYIGKPKTGGRRQEPFDINVGPFKSLLDTMMEYIDKYPGNFVSNMASHFVGGSGDYGGGAVSYGGGGGGGGGPFGSIFNGIDGAFENTIFDDTTLSRKVSRCHIGWRRERCNQD